MTDKDKSGLLDYTEFCEVLQVDPSPQSESVFRLYDYDKAGQIDAREFLIALSNYTGAGKEDKLKFAFSVFDEDGNGVITKPELIKMLKANHMASQDAEVARKADTIMAQADRDGDGVLTFDEFVIVSKKFPNILVTRSSSHFAMFLTIYSFLPTSRRSLAESLWEEPIQVDVESLLRGSTLPCFIFPCKNLITDVDFELAISFVFKCDYSIGSSH